MAKLTLNTQTAPSSPASGMISCWFGTDGHLYTKDESGNVLDLSLVTVLDEATEKTTPVGADLIPISDSENSYALKKLSYANIRSALPQGDNNLIRNPDMRIAQRGTSFTGITSSLYTLDGWSSLVGTSGAGVCAISQESSIVPTSAQAGVNTLKSLKFSCATAQASIGAGDYFGFFQRIEGGLIGPSVGQSLTLSFWVYAYKTGTYSVGFRNSGADRSYIAEYSIANSNTWQKVSITVPMDYSGGTWNYEHGIGLQVFWGQAVGSTYSTATVDSWVSGHYIASSNQANNMDSTNNTFYMANVKLEIGDAASQFFPRNIQQENAFNQRYLLVYGGVSSYENIAMGQCTSATQAYALLSFPVSMCNAPALSISSASDWALAGSNGGPVALTGLTSGGTSSSMLISGLLSATVAAGLVSGNATWLYANNTTNARIYLSSEL